MAIENKYINADVAAGRRTNAAFAHGSKNVTLMETFEVAAADTDLSVYRVFKNIPQEYIPVSIKIFNDVITGGTDYDLGLYRSFDENVADGIVIDREALAATLDMATIATRAAPKNGLGAVAIEDIKKRIYELAGDTLIPYTKELGYDVAFTAVTVGSTAGTISIVATFAQG